MFLDNLLQPSHLLVILAVALIVLGPKRLPEVGHALGRGLRDFRDAISGDHHDEHPELLNPEIAEFSANSPTPEAVPTPTASATPEAAPSASPAMSPSPATPPAAPPPAPAARQKPADSPS